MTAKDNHKLKAMSTMTAGVSPTKLEMGMTINIHGHKVRITHTDPQDTLVQYANLARREFRTHDLNSLIELGTFPTNTVLERPILYNKERATIMAVTGDCCYQVEIADDAGSVKQSTLPYADLITWHMGDNRAPAPKLSAAPSVPPPVAQEPAPPVDVDPQTRIEQLISETFELKRMINKLRSTHETVVAAYEEDIKRLETKAAILNPPKAEKAVCTLIQFLSNPEQRLAADKELGEKLGAGWVVLDITILGDLHVYTRIVTLACDVTSLPAPELTTAHKAEANPAESPAADGPQPPPPVPVTPPPVPIGTVILNQQPVSRALTNNVSRIASETKKIPTLADLNARREKDADEIQVILQRGRDKQEDLRRQFAQSPNLFPVRGASQ